MFVNTIMGGKAAMDAYLYKAPDQSFLAYLQSNMQPIIDTVSNVSSSFKDAVVGLYNKHNSTSVLNAAKALLFNTGSHINQNIIYTVPYDNMANANLAMQRYIMSDLEIQKLYNRNMCNGFQDTYFDMEPNNKGEERHSYMSVMDGVLYFDQEENGVVKHYSFVDMVSTEEIGTYEKISVLDTWHNALRMIASGYDPTDINGGEL